MNKMTPREKEVLALVVQGYSNEEIGRKLNISKHTAKAHISEILRKMELQTRAELCFLAGKEDLI